MFAFDGAGQPSVSEQIRDDRYYAAHLFGDLKDSRAVPILVPFLKDKEVNSVVPWSLGEIGDKSAIAPLMETLGDDSPDMRVLAICALEKLNAKEALPRLRVLLDDDARIHFDGLGSVATAARVAITNLSGQPYSCRLAGEGECACDPTNARLKRAYHSAGNVRRADCRALKSRFGHLNSLFRFAR